jgi:lipopolysaccharide transport system ATP-binding protein
VGVELAFEILRPVTLRPQIMLTTERGEHAFNAWDTHARWRSEVAPGRYVSTAWIPGNLLNEGWMAVSVFLSTPAPGRTIQHAKEMDVVAFQVTDPVEGDSAKGDWVGQWHGAVRPLLEWTVEADVAVRHGRA